MLALQELTAERLQALGIVLGEKLRRSRDKEFWADLGKILETGKG